VKYLKLALILPLLGLYTSGLSLAQTS